MTKRIDYYSKPYINWMVFAELPKHIAKEYYKRSRQFLRCFLQFQKSFYIKKDKIGAKKWLRAARRAQARANQIVAPYCREVVDYGAGKIFIK